jgi:DNA-binding LytR/AlgR family response regulator
LKNYIIIEKDIKVIKQIRTIVDSFDEMRFCGSSQDQDEALTLIFKNSPDIIFLDIDSIIYNLLEFLLDITQHSKNQPVFIALSSFKESAYNAYKYDFSDCLLKPLTELTLQRSILKYQKKHPSSICEMACPKSRKCEKICLKSNKDFQYLNTNEILFLKADNNTTDFHMKDGSIIGAYKTLKTFENTLPLNFLRIHKSYIINSCCISRIHYGKSICIITNPSHRIPFTKTFINNIDSINKSLSNRAFITLN